MSGNIASLLGSTATAPTIGTAASAALSGLSNTPATTQVGAQASNPQMNEFLTLLVAQLKNQNPMNPTDPTQFVSQLAQFSTVEQLTQSNSTLGNISQGVTGLGLGQYVGLINQPISATTSTLTIPTSGAPAAMTFNVTGTGLSKVNVAITNANGTLVDSIPVTGTSGTVAFNGTDSHGNALPAGQYGVALVGTGSTGQASAGTITTAGTVAAVTQGTNGTWQLQLKDGRTVAASAVTEVD
jgi:flagellar basal-body rod modification protein FlgD